MHAHRLDLLELLVDACYRLDRSEAMTKYKFVISTKGIMILVLWEESFKSLEGDYSNHLASPLVASCGEISPSPRIRCDKIKSPTRDAVLRHLETGHPNNRTQCGVTHLLKSCLIGICKDMMSWMDPMRALGMQDEVAGTSLVTRKFSSSISCWKGLHKL